MKARLLTWVVVCWLTGSVAIAVGSVEQLEDGLSVEPLEDGVWLYRSDKDWGDGKPITANGLFIVGEDSLAMIDTAWTDAQTGALIDWAEQKFSLPLKHVISTHWHWDRMGGMAEVNRRGISGYALDRSAELGAENGIEPPLLTFHETLRIELGNETLEAHFAGAGHTVDNTVVWLAQRKLLFGGCLIKSASSGLGYIDEADLPQWQLTMRQLHERYGDAVRVVPGHGEPAGLELLQHTEALVAAELR